MQCALVLYQQDYINKSITRALLAVRDRLMTKSTEHDRTHVIVSGVSKSLQEKPLKKSIPLYDAPIKTPVASNAHTNTRSRGASKRQEYATSYQHTRLRVYKPREIPPKRVGSRGSQPERELRLCPQCGCAVKAPNYIGHVDKRCPVTQQKQVSSGVRKQVFSGVQKQVRTVVDALRPVERETAVTECEQHGPLILCKACGRRVYEDRMDRHATNCEATTKPETLPPIKGRFPFVLLPPGEWKYKDLWRGQSNTRYVGGMAIEWERLDKIASLKPVLTHFGTKAWLGYAAYEFRHSSKVVLECPIAGNATYVLSGEWKRMIKYSKAELRNEYSKQCVRIVHSLHWLERIREALR